MKNRLPVIVLFSFLLLLPTQISNAQVPQGLNYMAIARDENKDIIPDADIKIRIAILRTITPLDIEWQEEQTAHTNETGLFRLTIGDPEATPVPGGHAAMFSEIDWKIQPLYIRTYIYLKGVWESVGDAELLSVPYAMMAGHAYGGVNNPFTMVADTLLFSNSIDVVGDDLAMDDAIFEVKRNDGVTMFAVYNQGVRINVPLIDAVKGVKGGFAISGFSGSKATSYTDLFTLNKDSARIYVDKTPDLTKGAKGGFAVGGFDLVGKAGIQEYLSITPDSARIFVKDSGKGVKGGFAVSGFGAKATPVNFLNITPDNYFIGHESGYKIQATGLYNSVVGYQAGKNLSTGGYNTMVGFNAGISTTSGNNNILIGNYSGNNLTVGEHNTLIGNSAGYSHTSERYNVMVGTASGAHLNSGYPSGSFNTFMGINSGYQIRASRDNVFIGTNAGYWLDNGEANTFIGIDAGRSQGDPPPNTEWPYRSTVHAYRNTFMGYRSGYYITNGTNNVAIGYYSGYSNANGTGNVFLGNQAGMNETGSDKLYVANSASNTLLFGDFATKRLGINTTTLTSTLNVGGDATVTGNLTAGSITAPVTGNVTGNLTGNVTGTLNGNLNGNVNDLKMGRISLSESGVVEYTGGFDLIWNKGDGLLTIVNSRDDVQCHYWFKSIVKGAETNGSGIVEAKSDVMIIPMTNFDGNSFEIHFGEGEIGLCSVWIQFFNGKLSGHYMK